MAFLFAFGLQETWYKRTGHDSWKYITTKEQVFATSVIGHHIVIPSFAELTPDGHLRVYAGYAWDGPSGPTLDTETWMRPSLVHDVLYQLLRLGRLPQVMRLEADITMLGEQLRCGMNSFRAYYSYLGVRWFAAKHAGPT